MWTLKPRNPTQLSIVLFALKPTVQVCGHVKMNLFVRSLYVTVIPKKILALLFASCRFKAVKNVETV